MLQKGAVITRKIVSGSVLFLYLLSRLIATLESAIMCSRAEYDHGLRFQGCRQEYCFLMAVVSCKDSTQPIRQWQQSVVSVLASAERRVHRCNQWLA